MMAIYTPRQVPSRSQKKKGGAGKIGKLIGTLLRRRKKTPPFQAPPTVTGTQRGWQLKRFSKTTIMVVGFGGVLAAIFWLSFQLLLRSDIFRLTDIRISGTRTMTERQILDLAGLQLGGSLLQFNAKAAEARIAQTAGDRVGQTYAAP